MYFHTEILVLGTNTQASEVKILNCINNRVFSTKLILQYKIISTKAFAL